MRRKDNYTKSGNGLDGAISQQLFGGNNRKAVQMQNTKKLEIITCRLPREQLNAVQRADERWKLSLQQSQIQRAKIYLPKTWQNHAKCQHGRLFAAMSSLEVLYRFFLSIFIKNIAKP